MTKRNLKKNKICKLNRADIWGTVYVRKKLTKFSKLKARRPNNRISIGNFKGIIMKRPKNNRRRKTRYGRALKLKQRLINFYGSLKNFQFKQNLLKGRKCKKYTFSSFINKLESRLDILLFRSNFVLTIYEARQLINHKKVLVNQQINSKPSTILNPQDIIYCNTIKKIKTTVKKVPFIFKYCPKYLHINYKTLEIGLYKTPKLKFLSFPFRFKIRRFLELYKA